MSEGSQVNLTSSLSYQYLSAITYTGFGAVFYIVIAKLLPTSDLGVVSLLIAIVNLLSIVFTFGLSTSAQHFISYNLGKKNCEEMYTLTKRLFTYGLLLSAAAIVFTLLIAGILARFFLHDASYTRLIEYVSFYAAALVMFGILHGSALGMQKFKTDAMVYLFSASISYFIGLLFYFVFHTITYLFLGITLAYVAGIVAYIIIIFARKPVNQGRTMDTRLATILSYSWPLILSGVMSTAAVYIDRFEMAYFMNLSVLGIYSFVLLVYSSIVFLTGPMSNILVPKLSEYFSQSDIDKLKSGVNLSSSVLLLIYSPVALGIGSIAPILLSLLAKSIYVSGSIALVILLGISSIFVLRYVLISVISAIRYTKVYILSSSLTLASNLLLSFILIPRFGMIGAGIANSSVPVVSFVILYYFAIIKNVKSFDWITILKLWFSSLIMFFFVTIERMSFGNYLTMLPVYITTGVVFYLVSLNLTRSLSRLEKEEFFSYIPCRLRLRKFARILLSRAF